MEYGGLDAFIDDLFIRSSYRKRGLAQAVLEALFAECKQRKVLALHVEVSPANTAAKALYYRIGLRPRDDDRQVLTTQFEEDLDNP